MGTLFAPRRWAPRVGRVWETKSREADASFQRARRVVMWDSRPAGRVNGSS
jgi:hypothetical protein